MNKTKRNKTPLSLYLKPELLDKLNAQYRVYVANNKPFIKYQDFCAMCIENGLPYKWGDNGRNV